MRPRIFLVPCTDNIGMKWWSGAKPVTTLEFESQQDKLKRMTGEVVHQYRRQMDAEVSDPGRLRAVYGSSFASAEKQHQAEVVAMMASSMLRTSNADVILVLEDRQKSVAEVRDGMVVPPDLETPLADSFCRNVITTGREFAVEQADEHPLVCDTSFARDGAIVSYLGVPIVNREGVIVGVLCVHDSCQRDWHQTDVALLTQLSFVLTRTIDPAPA